MSDALCNLLDEMQDAILRGHYKRLPDLARKLDDCMSHQIETDRGQLQELRTRSLRNQACLDAALAGLRLAQGRMRDIGKAAKGLTTYDARGATSVLTSQANPGRRA